MNPISVLNELGPSVKLSYDFKDHSEGFICILKLTKDRETFDTYGLASRKQDAKEKAAFNMVALLKLIFPMVPLALFNRAEPISSIYKYDDEFIITPDSFGFDLTEIKNGSIRIYVNPTHKTYTIATIPVNIKIVQIPCPIELLNEPIRFTDWSQTHLCTAQHNYIKRRIDLR